jgi:hypothetical protein
MGDAGRWRGLQTGRRRSYVGRHEARWGVASRRAVAVAGAVAVAAAVAVAGLASSGSRGADPSTARPAPPASQLIAAPGFGAGLGDWRAFPGTYLFRAQLGDPAATSARIQQDPSVPAAKDPATGATITGLTIRVVTGATASMRLRATVPVRCSSPGVTVVVRLSERVGDRRVDESERRASLRDTAWHVVEADHQVVEGGAAVHLEIWALALPPDQVIEIGQTKVMGA